MTVCAHISNSNPFSVVYTVSENDDFNNFTNDFAEFAQVLVRWVLAIYSDSLPADASQIQFWDFNFFRCVTDASNFFFSDLSCFLLLSLITAYGIMVGIRWVVGKSSTKIVRLKFGVEQFEDSVAFFLRALYLAVFLCISLYSLSLFSL
uniref:Uncharacterized protein n=1 Tax=Nicotiana tabacum TaxID=4097 RepID=A0A1S3X679_TOBAC|nr:PREDICTED: uncharacterized protein LOC107761625 [Nicotiana tabacum]